VTEPKRRDEYERDDESPVAREAKAVSRGRATRTPFVALGGVAAAVWAFAGILTIALLVLIWVLS
jgi:hypothetical protein